MIRRLRIFFFFIVLVAILSTVFVFASDNVLRQGVITAKYFWFASVMCGVSLLIPFQLSTKNEIHVTDVLIGVLFFYIFINYFFLNGFPNMNSWLSLLMFPLYIAVRSVAENEKLQQWFLITILVVILMQTIWGLLQLYGFTHSHHYFYKITGTMFNPGPYAGFLAVGIPLALSFSLNKTLPRWMCWLGLVMLITAAFVLPVTMSRAAWIAAVAGCVPILIQNAKFKKNHLLSVKYRIIITTSAVFLLITLLVSVYLMKKDSAGGRWVVWNASMEAIKENPFFGAGYGRFSAVYGNAQATYFLKQERSPNQIMVADSPDYAFNEYVLIVVELGILGLLLFLFLISSSLFSLNSSFLTIRSSLLTFLVFAAFSYPFSVLPLAILFVFLLALSAPASKKISINFPIWLKLFGMVAVCWGLTAYGSYQILSKRAAYREWTTAFALCHDEVYQPTSDKYKSLYPQLRHEKHFLFEYAQCLSKTGKNIESTEIFEEYLNYGSDPMVFNCIGNNYKEMGEYEKAEKMYIRASQIVPNRHYPLYLLMLLYKENGQIEKAKSMAKTLLSKPVKIHSTAIREMHEEARKIINIE